MSTVGTRVIVESAGEASHGRFDRKAVRVVLIPALTLCRRDHRRGLGKRVFPIRKVLVGRRLHDFGIEDVCIQDSGCFVVVEVSSALGVLLELELVLLVLVSVVDDGRVYWTCLLIREPVVCSKGHAGAKQATKRASVQTGEGLPRRGAVYLLGCIRQR